MFHSGKFTLLRNRMKLVSLGIQCSLWKTYLCKSHLKKKENKRGGGDLINEWDHHEIWILNPTLKKKRFGGGISHHWMWSKDTTKSQKIDSKSYPQLAKYIPRFSQTIPRTVLVNHLHMYKIHHTALFTLIIFDRWTHYLRQGTSPQYQYCYLDFVIWYYLSAQPIPYK